MVPTEIQYKSELIQKCQKIAMNNLLNERTALINLSTCIALPFCETIFPNKTAEEQTFLNEVRDYCFSCIEHDTVRADNQNTYMSIMDNAFSVLFRRTPYTRKLYTDIIHVTIDDTPYIFQHLQLAKQASTISMDVFYYNKKLSEFFNTILDITKTVLNTLNFEFDMPVKRYETLKDVPTESEYIPLNMFLQNFITGTDADVYHELYIQHPSLLQRHIIKEGKYD